MVVGGYIAAWIALSIATAFLMGRFFKACEDRSYEGSNSDWASPSGRALVNGARQAVSTPSGASIPDAASDIYLSNIINEGRI